MNNTQIELDLASSKSSQETIFLREMASRCEEANKNLYGDAFRLSELYWMLCKARRKQGKTADIKNAWLGLRIKPTINKKEWLGAFSILWQKSKTYPSPKGGFSVSSTDLRKGLKAKYNLKVFLGYEKWESESAIELEEEFEKVRNALDALSKAKRALAIAEKKVLIVQNIDFDELKKNIK